MPMKRIIITTALLAAVFTVFAQSQIFPIWFEDAAGNKDTLWFGYDLAATAGLDENFDEINLLGQPMDTVLNVFFTDAARSVHDHYFEFERNPTFATKRQIINDRALIDWFELGIVAKHWPITIKWPNGEMKKYISGLNYTAHLFLYSWTPPTSVVGDVHTCGNWPNDFTLMNDTTEVTVRYDNFCHYSAPSLSSDSISPFYIMTANFTGLEQQVLSPIQIRFDKNTRSIVLDNLPDSESFTLTMYDLMGQCLLNSTWASNGSAWNVPLNPEMKGVFLVQIDANNAKSNLQTFKIAIE